ncbi:amidohydrolase family protein [Haliangium sp.]|uniref:amidohydrolase family protein n=1 Tax=Haliangium sp. TaxID=2663208 RepID=UPI003D0B4D9F
MTSNPHPCRCPGVVVWVLVSVAVLACGGRQGTPATDDVEEVVYVLMTTERRSGELVVRTHPDGLRVTHFTFQDRGRGPDLRSETRTDARGFITALSITGHDYWKSPVDETLALAGGHYRWKNEAEQGQAEATQSAFYVPLDASFGAIELLARALLVAPERSVSLLPAGRARIEELETMTVQADESQRELTLYAISGLTLTPMLIWLDADRHLFASAEGWFALIREGWEATLPRLREHQEEAVRVRLRAIAEHVPRVLDRPLAVRDVAVFDPRSGQTRPGMTVLVRGPQIDQVGPVDAVTIPADALVVDGHGHTLLPGLWDMHVHIGPVDGILHLAAGVTTARDLANEIDQTIELRDRFDRGELIGPRLILAGFMDGSGPYAGPNKVIVDTEEQARAAIERYRELGYEQIKLYSSIDPALVPYIVATAHQAGLRVSGHIPAFMTAEQAVRQGYDEIQHINMLVLNFLYEHVQDTRTPARFTAIAEYGADLDLSSEQVRDFIRLLVEEDVVIDPTIATFEGMFKGRPGQAPPSYAAIVGNLPIQLQRTLRKSGLPVPEGQDERFRAGFQTMLDLIGLLYKAGVRLVPGTDDLAGYTLHRELELYVEAGIPAPQALRLATLGAAEISGRADRLGTIEPGKLADLVLVAGDPAQRIGDIRNTALTIKGGRLYPAAALYEQLGISHDRGPMPALTTADGD